MLIRSCEKLSNKEFQWRSEQEYQWLVSISSIWPRLFFIDHHLFGYVHSLRPAWETLLCSVLRHSEFSAEPVGMVTVSAQGLQSAGWCLEQVLRERISWSPRSRWLVLGNGTSVYHCESLGSNENVLKIATVLCLAAPLFPGAPHSGGNRSLTV